MQCKYVDVAFCIVFHSPFALNPDRDLAVVRPQARRGFKSDVFVSRLGDRD